MGEGLLGSGCAPCEAGKFSDTISRNPCQPCLGNTYTGDQGNQNCINVGGQNCLNVGGQNCINVSICSLLIIWLFSRNCPFLDCFCDYYYYSFIHFLWFIDVFFFFDIFPSLLTFPTLIQFLLFSTFSLHLLPFPLIFLTLSVSIRNNDRCCGRKLPW